MKKRVYTILFLFAMLLAVVFARNSGIVVLTTYADEINSNEYFESVEDLGDNDYSSVY